MVTRPCASDPPGSSAPSSASTPFGWLAASPRWPRRSTIGLTRTATVLRPPLAALAALSRYTEWRRRDVSLCRTPSLGGLHADSVDAGTQEGPILEKGVTACAASGASRCSTGGSSSGRRGARVPAHRAKASTPFHTSVLAVPSPVVRSSDDARAVVSDTCLRRSGVCEHFSGDDEHAPPQPAGQSTASPAAQLRSD